MKKSMAWLLTFLLLLGGCNTRAGSQGAAPPESQSPATASEQMQGDPAEPEQLLEIDDTEEPEEEPAQGPERLNLTPGEARELLRPDEQGRVEIDSVRQLAALAALVASGDTAHERNTYVLLHDLSLYGYVLSPIGGGETATASPAFGGTFDGGGHILSHVTVESEYTYGAGLFGALSPTGKIQNLHVTDGAVTSAAGNSAGGLVGMCYGEVFGCTYRGTVTCPGTAVGGLVGMLGNGSNTGKIAQSCSNAQVSGNSEVGGFTGGTAGGSVISDCYALGSVTAIQPAGRDMPYQVGGFIGSANSSVIERCYSHMEVYTKAESRWVGAFIGYASGGPQKCYYNMTATENWKDICVNYQDSAYDLTGCTVEELLDKQTYRDWDFDTVWEIDGKTNRGLPFLRVNWE